MRSQETTGHTDGDRHISTRRHTQTHTSETREIGRFRSCRTAAAGSAGRRFVSVPAPIDPRVRVPRVLAVRRHLSTLLHTHHPQAQPHAATRAPAPRAFAHAPHIQAVHAHSACTRTTHTICTLRALTLPHTHTHHPHTHSHTRCTRKLRSAYAPPAPPAALTQSAYACIIDHSMMHAIRRRRPWKRKGKRAQSRSTPQRFR